MHGRTTIKIYDSVFRAEGFGLHLAKVCVRIAALTFCKQYILSSFGIYQLESCLCFVRGVAVKLAQVGVRRHFLGETAASNSKGNTGTIINRCSDNIVRSAGDNGFSCDC
jgi:hypothetical protein